MSDFHEITQLKYQVEMCFKVLNNYSWLLDAYILDFFTENHMEKLPKSWKNHIKQTSLEEFYYLIHPCVKTESVWPLSILCLKVLAQFLTLKRQINKTQDFNLIQANKVNMTKIQKLSKIKSIFFEHPKLRNLFLKHVKPKKRYEMFKMAITTAELANELDVKFVVDVGSGLGHLSRIMAYGFNLNVCSIETQLALTKQAEMMDVELEKVATKHLSESEMKLLKSRRPVHLNSTIRCDLTATDFIADVKEAFCLRDENIKIGIIGLHPCGDLAAVLLKLYINCPEAKFINLVGCCYHKLTTVCDSKNDVGFPLTEFCFEKCSSLSYEARALACHAVESYRERLISKNYSHLRIHCYRAALESLISKNWPEHRKTALSNVKSVPGLKFSEYCQLALKKLKVNIPEKDLESEETLRNLSYWKDVVKFYTLRLMLAPLIETVILLDRKIFLLERGVQCRITAAFDPEISPRNQLLISQKIV